MAIYTKFGGKVIQESLRVDQDCIFSGEIVKAWASVDGEAGEKQYWLSDLVGDAKREVRDAIRANLKRREATAKSET